MMDTISGQVQANFAVIPAGMAQVKGGRLRAVAVTSAKRFPAIPNVPTVAETLPGYEIATWFGLLAPAGTSRSIVQKLNGEVAKVLSEAQTRTYLEANGFQPLTSSPDELAAFIKSEMAKWAKIVKESGVKLDSD